MDLFNTVPKTEHMKFVCNEDGSVNPRELSDFLGLARADLAAIVGVSTDSVRFDDRMSIELREKIAQLANICEIVAGFFDGNQTKTKTWFVVENPCLNNRRPIEMIKSGEIRELGAMIIKSSCLSNGQDT